MPDREKEFLEPLQIAGHLARPRLILTVNLPASDCRELIAGVMSLPHKASQNMIFDVIFLIRFSGGRKC